MTVILIVGLSVAGILIIASVSAWGVVQILNAQEILEDRRERKRLKLQKAREYLKNPQGQGTWATPNTWVTQGNYTDTYTTQNNTAYSDNTNMTGTP